MTVILDLPIETEQVLKEKASRAGQTLEVYLKELIKREAQVTNNTSPLSPLGPEEWIAQLHSWAERQRPRSVVLDDSRESIYAGRDE